VSKDIWHVFQERISGSYCAKDCDNLGPKVAVVCCAFVLTGNREGLAWKSRCNHFRNSSVFASCTGEDEVTNIAEHWCGVENSVLDALGDDSLAVVVDLDVADTGEPEQLGSEDAEPGAAKQG
jgi:hypothetical protein